MLFRTLHNPAIFRTGGIFGIFSSIYGAAFFQEPSVTLIYLEKPSIFIFLVHSETKAYSEHCWISIECIQYIQNFRLFRTQGCQLLLNVPANSLEWLTYNSLLITIIVSSTLYQKYSILHSYWVFKPPLGINCY